MGSEAFKQRPAVGGELPTICWGEIEQAQIIEHVVCAGESWRVCLGPIAPKSFEALCARSCRRFDAIVWRFVHDLELGRILLSRHQFLEHNATMLEPEVMLMKPLQPTRERPAFGTCTIDMAQVAFD